MYPRLSRLAIQEITHFVYCVAAGRGLVDSIARQFLPVDGATGKRGEPFNQFWPTLIAELKRYLSVFANIARFSSSAFVGSVVSESRRITFGGESDSPGVNAAGLGFTWFVAAGFVTCGLSPPGTSPPGVGAPGAVGDEAAAAVAGVPAAAPELSGVAVVDAVSLVSAACAPDVIHPHKPVPHVSAISYQETGTR